MRLVFWPNVLELERGMLRIRVFAEVGRCLEGVCIRRSMEIYCGPVPVVTLKQVHSPGIPTRRA